MAMAQNQAPAFFFAAALLLLAAAAPPARAQLLTPAVVLNAIRITGVVPCPGGGGIGGVNLTMSCRSIVAVGPGSGSIVVSQVTTGLNGVFNILIPDVPTLLRAVGGTLASLLAGDLPCLISVRLPVDELSCPVLSGVDGVLVGDLSVVGNVISGLGNVLNFTVGFVVSIISG